MQALSNLIYKIKMSGWTVDHKKHIDDDIGIGMWEAFWDIDFRFTNNIKLPVFAHAHRITDPTLIVLPVAINIGTNTPAFIVSNWRQRDYPSIERQHENYRGLERSQ